MQEVRPTASARKALRTRLLGGRSTRLPWILFLLFGVPFGLMAALGPLSAAGIFIEPLRPLWRPWPPDPMKPFIGAAIFVATLAFLAYRRGRIAGFHSGTIAASVALRNMAEGRGPGALQGLIPPPPPALETRPPSPADSADSQEGPRTVDNPTVEPDSPPGAS